MIAPANERIRSVDPSLLVDPEEIEEPKDKTIAEKLEYSRVITWILGLSA
jgi:short subunit fatty acids transporter